MNDLYVCEQVSLLKNNFDTKLRKGSLSGKFRKFNLIAKKKNPNNALPDIFLHLKYQIYL